jgi:Protein of unknown function (DUF1592)/Protein of unknown function (DUF1588)/Protein of unknown function (DUF1595)/Protein of unknown function (DUF1585)/Protein of unknown function (DUF1587)
MKQLKFFVLGMVFATATTGCSGTIGKADGETPGDDGLNGQGGNGDPGENPEPGEPGEPADVPTIVPIEDVCTDTKTVGTARWRRLTAAQYRNSVKDLLGIDADTSAFLFDTRAGAFASNAKLPVQADDVEHYRATAVELAKQAASGANLTRILGCDTAAKGEDVCAAAFVDTFGAKVYRHPLAPDQKTQLNKLYTVGKEESFAAGIRLVIEGALQSPHFLYLPEFGGALDGGIARLTGHEVATRLSYLFWETTPDADLMSAASSGALDDLDGIKTQAARLLASPRFLAAVGSFHTQLLEIDRLEKAGAVVKDTTRYPMFNDGLRSAMLTDSKKFFEHVFSKGDSSMQTLLTASYAFPSGPLMDVYGATGKTAAADGRIALDGARFGMLTSAAVLAVHPHTNTLFPAVARGKMIRNNLLCTDLPAPPMAVMFNPPANAAMLSEQELNRRHQDDPSCNSCHSLMEPAAFGLDSYDAVGKIRTTANDGSPIDGTGDLLGTDVEGAYKGAAELTARLARSQDVRACMSEQWFRFTLGRVTEKADACSLQTMAHVMAEGTGDVRAALLALVTTDAFRYRKGQ